MSRSYQKYSAVRAHFREFGATTMRRDVQKQMRGRVKAMRDEDGEPYLPRKVSFHWPGVFKRKWNNCREDYAGMTDVKLPRIGRKLKILRKYGLSREDLKFIYQTKTK